MSMSWEEFKNLVDQYLKNSEETPDIQLAMIAIDYPQSANSEGGIDIEIKISTSGLEIYQ